MSREMIVGRALPGFAVDVERDPLRLFARTIGDRRPECHDVEAARAAGTAIFSTDQSVLDATDTEAGP